MLTHFRLTAEVREHWNFEIFSKCLENSKNLQDYSSKVSDYEYLLNFVILYCCCGEIMGWAAEGLAFERGNRVSAASFLKLRLNTIISVQKRQLQRKLKHYTSRVAILCAFIYKTISDKNKKRGGIILLLRPYCNPTLKPHLALKTWGS